MAGAGPVATAVGLFLAVSWLGLWLWLPPMARAFGLFAFAVLARGGDGAAAVRALSHRPRPAAPARSQQPAYRIARQRRSPTRWQRRRGRVVAGIVARPCRARAAARALAQGRASRRRAWSARDPLALRALVLLLVVATFFAAGGERCAPRRGGVRLAGRRRPGEFPARCLGVAARLYRQAAGHPAGLRPGEQMPTDRRRRCRCRPAACSIVRASGKAQFEVATTGGLAAEADQQSHAPTGTEEHRFTISGRGTAFCVGSATDEITWAFNAVPDQARRPSRSPRIPSRRRAARCSSPTRSRTITASSRRTGDFRPQGQAGGGGRSSAVRAARICRWRCRRRARATASVRP